MESHVSKPVLSDRFWLGATAILVLGIALRQFRIGEAPIHSDEAIHAFFAEGFGNYHYNPIYHGPLLYHLVAATFGIFGESDATARLVPSLLGIGLLALILGPMRQFLGTRGAIASAALVAVSPSIVSYSRRILHDSLVLFLTLSAVYCLMVALENGANTRRGSYARIGLAVASTLFLATKANCFFIFAMLGAFYIAWRLAGLLKTPLSLSRWVPASMWLLVSLFAIAFPRDNTFDEITKKHQHLVFQVVALLCCVLMGLWLLTRSVPEEEAASKRNWRSSSDATTYILALAAILWIYVFLYGQGAQILSQWSQTGHFPRPTFEAGSKSARSAITDMLAYWYGQQKEPRLPSRHDYYLVLLLLYELPILLVALGGIWHASKNRSVFSDLLLWWAFTSWTVYAVANEKVPWLAVHIVLPLALLGGLWLGQIRWGQLPAGKPILAMAALTGFLFVMRGVSAVNFERGGDHAEPLLYAQTPDAFRDAIRQTLHDTRADKRSVWLADERQWPSVWYVGKHQPDVGESPTAIAGKPTPSTYRAVVCKDTQWEEFEKLGWTSQTVGFLVWTRASWAAFQPHRFFPWFLTRNTMPENEIALLQDQWKTSILAGKGEWCRFTAVIGHP